MTKRMFVYELPYSVRKSLCQILDASDKWEELGGEHMGFDDTYLRYIRRKDSPTDELLSAWGNQNHTVNDLFVFLSKMQHYRAMSLIKDLVQEQYHHLLREGEELMSQLPISKPVADQSTPTPNRNHNVSIQAHLSQEPSSSTARVYAANGLNMDNKDLGLNLQNLNLKSRDKENRTTKNVCEIKIQNIPDRTSSSAVDQNCNNNDISNRQQAAYNPNFNPIPSSANLKPCQGRKLSSVSVTSSVMEGCTPLISYEELEMATDGWNTACILGRGGFGTVYKGTWKNTSVAVKKLESQRNQSPQTSEINDNQLEQSLRELKYLNSHRHDNILSLYGYSITDRASCLVYQYMANGSLEDRLHCRQNTRPLTWAQRLNIMTGTARGIQFLHSLDEKPLVHGDIKSANILLDNNFEPRIGDFGLAREGPLQQYTHVKVSRVHGTRPYLPDEFLRGKKFSVKVDTYSFGVVLFEVATGLKAYDENRKEKFLKDHIMAFETELLGGLADARAGNNICASASGLLMLGRYCVSTRAKDRPDMAIVLNDVEGLYNNYKRFQHATHLARQHSLSPTTPIEIQIAHDERRSPLPPSDIPLARQHVYFAPVLTHSPEAQVYAKQNPGLVQVLPGNQTGWPSPIVIHHPPHTPTLAVQAPTPQQSRLSPQVDEVFDPLPPPQLNSINFPLVTLLGTKSGTGHNTLDSPDKSAHEVVSSQVTDYSNPSDSISELDLSPNTSDNSLASETRNAEQSLAANSSVIGLQKWGNNSKQVVTNPILDSNSDFTSSYLPLIPGLIDHPLGDSPI